MRKLIWLAWALVTMALFGYYSYTLFAADDKSDFVVGPATHGHYQIEMACETCHTDSFGGPEMLQGACENCHAAELEESRDEHPKKKFTNPRNAELITILDARQCISCHSEHQQEQTREMGLTLPTDYCFHCHQEVGENRESHKDLPYDSCQTAGCHNFHDNRALHEYFLVENAGQPWLNQITALKEANYSQFRAAQPQPQALDTSVQTEIAATIADHPDIQQQWASSAHAGVQVQCATCHIQDDNSQWLAKPEIDACESCHQQEVAGFTSGKHGMRLSSKLSKPLSPMTPDMARLDFHPEVGHEQLGCNSCHDVHALDTQVAAAESCIGCHADEHSIAYDDSPHAELWQAELAGIAEPGTGVSCATCHMPRIEGLRYIDREAGIKEISVQHNQNATLRPNEKMVRPVCMQCHGYEFSIDALADDALIKNNFNGQPAVHIESADWAIRREQ